MWDPNEAPSAREPGTALGRVPPRGAAIETGACGPVGRSAGGRELPFAYRFTAALYFSSVAVPPPS